jgi:uncharacterized protein YggE
MKQSITLKFNVWIICAILLLTNLVTVGLWQPWNNNSVSSRTIAITGTSTLEAAPDQFIFNPYYQKEGDNKAVLDAEISDLSKAIIAKLKELGVKDSVIKADVSSYDNGVYQPEQNSNQVVTLNLTVTLKDKDLAQKVQDYLTTTSPSGSVTPQSSFSIAKQKELETNAREGALKDARTKAKTSADQLGAQLGRVVKVTDMTSIGISPLPWLMGASNGAKTDSATSSSTAPSYSIQTGLNEYSFNVEVTYELK